MPFLSCLPENHHLSDVFKAFPHHVKPLLEYHDVLLRGESPLTLRERELIAAFVSGLNACSFCFGAHRVYAELYGTEEGALDKLLEDIDTAPIDDKLKPLFRYLKKLTEEPSRITQADADAVLTAGWSERALFDAVSVCALFNFMNRIIEGTGTKVNPDLIAARQEDLQKQDPQERLNAGSANIGSPDYSNWGRTIGVIE